MAKTTTSKKNQKKEDHVEIVEPEPVVESDPEPEPEPEPERKPAKKNTKKTTSSAVSVPVQVSTQSQVATKGKKPTSSVSDWNAMGDDISVEEVNNSEDEEEHEQEEELAPRNTFRSGGKNTRPPQQTQKPASRFANSATNFNYQTYTDLETPVNELSNKDLVKILIVRSYGENQYDFCKTMKTVLRAMNLECPMPGTRPNIEGSQQSSYQQQSYGQTSRPPARNQQSSGKPYQSQTQSIFGQRPQKRSQDPHDF